MICDKTSACFPNMLNNNTRSCSSSDCLVSRDDRKNIVCKDKRSTTYRLSNPDGLTAAVVKLDGGVVKNDPRTKCDGAILLGNPGLQPVAVLVELKGNDTPHAVEQISSALELFKATWKGYRKIYGRIVGTKAPWLGSGGDKAYRNLNTALISRGGNLDYQRPTPVAVDSVQVVDNEIVIPKKKGKK